MRALPNSRAAPDACSGRQQVTVEGVPPDTYLERFAWNEAKYPPRRPLKETVAAITETAQKLEDELKARAPVPVLPAACLLGWHRRVAA